MHGVRKELLEKKAKSLGINFKIIELPKNVNNDEYATIMKKELLSLESVNINCVVFGDIFLEDIWEYRELNLAKIGMRALFPLWRRNTRDLAKEFINLGFKAIITCVDSTFLDKSDVSQVIFLKSLDF